MPIRVLIAEPHEMIRSSLISAIEAFNDFEKVGDTGDGYEALRLCEELKPDVLLLGLYTREMDGLTTTRLMREKPNCPFIIMIDGLWGEEHEDSALEAGVNVYFTLETSVNDIVKAIRAANLPGQPGIPSQ
jgi:DNA-binding NarL/FixJ family response regulator